VLSVICDATSPLRLQAPLSKPLFADLNEHVPARFIGALPVLTPSLRWVDDEKIYVVGSAAGLEIGPGALNLMGAQRAGQLVADDLQELMYKQPEKTEAKSKGRQNILRNAYLLLGVDSSGSELGSDSDEDGQGSS